MIAKCNLAENDVPEQVYTSPTIRLYAVNEKGQPMTYFGDPTDANDCISFIEELSPRGFKPASRRNSPTISEFEEPPEARMRESVTT